MKYALTLLYCAALLFGLIPQPAIARQSEVLRLAMPAPQVIDPVQISRFDPYTRDLIENLYVGLTRFNPITREIEPMIAESWAISDDGLVWTFNLRDDIQWVEWSPDTQDFIAVRPVVAGDFVYAIQRACDPLRPSPVTENLMIIRGCQTVANAFPEVINDLMIAREIGARATGPTTLEITLQFPASYFLTLTSTPEFRPIARETAPEVIGAQNAANVITSGPYALKDWNAQGMTLVRNPYWPDSYAGNIDQIDITFSSTPVELASSDQVDMVRLASTQDIQSAQTAVPDLIHTTTGSTLVMFGFSFDRNVVNVAEVRRALSMAIDRNALVSQFFPGQVEATAQFTPGNVAADPEFSGTLFDPAQAQAALTAAGYEGCANIPEKSLILVPDDDPIWAQIGQFMIEQWTTNLGCNPALFEVQTLSHVLLIEMAHATYDAENVTRSPIWFATWSPDYPDANAWLGDLHCEYGYFRVGRECDSADDLLDTASLENDPAARAALYAQVEDLFFGANGTFPVLPLYIINSVWLQQPSVLDVNEAGPARYDLWTLNAEEE
jgi:ABC-type oligopeptide transport system substrate-binding subunit